MYLELVLHFSVNFIFFIFNKKCNEYHVKNFIDFINGKGDFKHFCCCAP